MLPVLGALEERHANDPLAILGIHSAKFDNEKAPDHILSAMERYGVRHPVLVDSNMTVWQRYGIRSWPTLVLIRPNGRIAAIAPGEPDLESLENAVERIMAEARADGTLAKGPVLKPPPAPAMDGPVAFPGKLLAAPDGRLFVSDSGHHRVLVLRSDGTFVDAIGSGLRGRADGSFAQAALDDPQGLALDGDRLYIADARAHVILAADLAARTVARVAGTGELGDRPLGSPRPALATALRSPWDLALDGRRLLFAAAGSHQIGVLDLDAGTVACFAGDGGENIQDGGPDEAEFAQPSGLWLAGRTLFVADSETSAVRALDLGTLHTRTLTGTGLFDWADSVGPARGRAVLQHPLAVAMTPRGLVVADTYNSKLKRFSADLASVEALPSTADGVTLDEPGGLAVAPDGSLLVADTNRSRIVRIDPEGKTARVLALHGVPSPGRGVAIAGAAVAAPAPAGGPAATVLGAARARAGAPLEVVLVAPEGFELSAGAPWSIAIEVEGAASAVERRVSGEAKGGAETRVTLPLRGRAGSAIVTADVRADVCDARTHRACYPVEQRFRIPLEIGEAADAVPVTLPLSPPRT